MYSHVWLDFNKVTSTQLKVWYFNLFDQLTIFKSYIVSKFKPK